MWRWVTLAFVIVAGLFEGARLVNRYGADINDYDLSGPCAWRSTDRWGWADSRTVGPNAKTERILFVGDDMTFDNDLPGMLTRVASSDPSAPVRFQVRSVTAPDAGLDKLWNDGCGLKCLKTDHYDVVLLQEHSYFWFPQMAEAARESAARWISAARTYGARPVYFELWTIPGDPDVDPGEALQAAQENARTNGAEVTRIGEAFTDAFATPGVPDLFQADRHQPSQAGTWLAALVIYHQLTGAPAARPTWRPNAVTPAQAAVLQRIADRFG